MKGDPVKEPTEMYFVVDQKDKLAFIDLIYFLIIENNTDGIISEDCKILNW